MYAKKIKGILTDIQETLIPKYDKEKNQIGVTTTYKHIFLLSNDRIMLAYGPEDHLRDEIQDVCMFQLSRACDYYLTLNGVDNYGNQKYRVEPFEKYNKVVDIMSKL